MGAITPRKKARKYFWTNVKVDPATENSLQFRSCRPIFMSNSHFESFEDILTPSLKFGLVSTEQNALILQFLHPCTPAPPLGAYSQTPVAPPVGRSFGLATGTGTARVHETSHSFRPRPHVYPQLEWTILPLLLSRRASAHFGNYSLLFPLKVGGWVDL